MPNPIKTIIIDIHKWIFLFALPIISKIIGTIKTLVPVINADLLGFEGAKKILLPNPSHKPVVWNEYPKKRNIPQINPDINSNDIILYMKGTKEMPMCGFSSTVVKVLSMYNIQYKDINVLEDPNIRIKLSEHSNWPTIPQLFVKGELIGGCDILVELHNSNELEKILS